MALFKKDKWAAGGQSPELTAVGRPRLLTNDDARNVGYPHARNALIGHLELGAMMTTTDDAAAQHHAVAGQVSLLAENTPFECELSLGDGTAIHYWLLPTLEARSRGAVWEYMNTRTGLPGVEQI
jgi:hypothetical protein